MKLAQFVIKRKTMTSMLFIGMLVLGFFSYRQLPVELLPSAELPFLIVQVGGFREMDVDYVEREAIIPLEGAISTLEGIDRIESFADRRRSTIMVYFNQNVQLKYVYLRLLEKLNLIRAELQDEFIVDVLKIDTEQLTNVFMGLQVRGSGGIDRVRQIADDKIVRRLESIDGIANVEIFGGKQQSLEIILNEQASRAYGITTSEIRNLLMQNSRNKTFVGQVYEGERRFFVNVVADYIDVTDLENIVVNKTGPVLLRDVATVYRGIKEPTSISRVNGLDAVTIQLMRDTQANLIQLAHQTRATLEMLNRELSSQQIEIVIQSDAAEQIEQNIDLIMQLALVGGLLAVIILWFFLRQIRLVLTISLAIPISIFTAFNLFYLFNVTINSLTLIGIALAIGMLVDNSIVVLENIYRLLGRGKDVNAAVIQGSGEVWRSILASSLTTMTVFLPFVFAANFIIQIMGRQIGIAIISSLLVSLLVALLLIPMVVHFVLERFGAAGEISLNNIRRKSRPIQIYNLLLKSCLRFPARTVVGGIILFFASLLICLALSLDVPHEVEADEFSLYVTMPKGATLERTDQVTLDLEQKLTELAEKQDITSKVYEEEAIITIKLQEKYQTIRNLTLPEIKEQVQRLLNRVETAEVSFEQPTASGRYRSGGAGGMPMGNLNFERMLGIGSPDERIIVKGRDHQIMRNVSEDIRGHLENLDNISRVQLDVEENRPEIHLLFDHHLMSHYDIGIANVAGELTAFEEQFSSNVSFKQGIEEIDITIRNENETEKKIDDLKQLRIKSASGGSHGMEEIAQIIYSFGQAGINRVNQEKQIGLTYRFQNEVTSNKEFLTAARAEIDLLIASLNFPPGIIVEVIHDESQLDDFYFLIAAAFILIYMILASVFESLVTPVVMLFTIPLAAIGALWALILTGNSILNANSLMGFLILLGIVVNNGIIYIDYTRILRDRRYRQSRALLMAGQARVRPIMITAATTIVALIPLAMGKTEYVAQIGAPFAITVIGGLAFSTLFTLVLIPTFYSGLDRALSWLRNLDWKVKLLQAIILITLCLLIYQNIDNLIWRFVNLIAAIICIPAITFFLLSSLRRARVDLIRADEPIRIVVRHLVKIYDADSRFIREWKKGKMISSATSSLLGNNPKSRLIDLTWKIAIYGFLIYFLYFYQTHFFWVFVLSHVFYFYGFVLGKNIIQLITAERIKRASMLMRNLYYWFFPFMNLLFFSWRWRNLAAVILIGVVWYLLLGIYSASQRIYQNNFDITSISGFIGAIRRSFFRIVPLIPFVGKKRFPFKALDSVSLEIGTGMFGLLGPNGAGKTTLMRIICGILEQNRGKIWINDIDLQEKREELQGLIGYLPQEFGCYDNMTAEEFLDYQAMLKGIVDLSARRARINYVLSAVHLEESRAKTLGSYSGGMKQRIGIAQTLLHLPRILVVDEPTAGLDPRERIRFRNLLVELSRDRVVIFSTHIIEDISSSCNKVAVLNEGKLMYLGQPTDMTELARGHVWQFLTSAEEFETLRKQLQIVHNIRVKDQIRIRCLSAEKPFHSAQNVSPTLEDAYLWLIREQKN